MSTCLRLNCAKTERKHPDPTAIQDRERLLLFENVHVGSKRKISLKPPHTDADTHTWAHRLNYG